MSSFTSHSPENLTPIESQSSMDDSESVNSNDLPPQRDNAILPVVGLGGSAGSIGALQNFFSRIPPNLGMAYVVVIHLAPDHQSSLPQIIQARTSMPVVQVTGTLKLEPDHVYVIPPTNLLAMDKGKIYLTDLQQSKGKRVAVDLFFRTLAASHRSKAVAIVLSGTDGDGAIGIKRIKENGGVTVAQDPDEAEYDGMPRSAIATGMVDWILPIDQMADKMVEFIHNEGRIRLPLTNEEDSPNVPREDVDEMALREILSFLYSRTGHDFSHYKRATVLRRIGRRLQVNSLESLPPYANFLRTHPGEAGALLQDLLISVTNFFRDPKAFWALETWVPRLFRDKTTRDSVRIWVPGCATGEEAYSLAMLLLEHAENIHDAPEIQIFATDLDEEALRAAREGVYPATIVADVSPARLRRFFISQQGRFRIKKEVRERVLFAPHNLLKDSPFSRLDLVSCRNLLIYFNREAQGRVFDLFHFALRPNGLLFLGGSESADDSPLFGVQDKKYRIYERKNVTRAQISLINLGIPQLSPIPDVSAVLHTIPRPLLLNRDDASAKMPVSFAQLHVNQRQKSALPSVLVNARSEIVHLSEGVSAYLRFAGGEMSSNLLAVVPPELRLELRAALFRAQQSGEKGDVASVSVDINGEMRVLGLQVRPLLPETGSEETGAFVMVVFDDQTGTEQNVLSRVPLPADSIAQRLEHELQHLKTELQASVAQYEGSVEELKAANEELQAMNEEQRSAGEELETSREEIQAANEELITLNSELKSKVAEISHSNSDLQNLMAATDIAIIFLSRDLRIKRYTPRTEELFRLISSDMGRPLADLRHSFLDENFIVEADEVVRTLVAFEREVNTNDGHWFLLRIAPYRTLEDKIDGVVLTFVDITGRKEAEENLRQSEERFRAVFNQATAGIAVTDLTGRFVLVNQQLCKILGYSNDELLELRLQDITYKDDLASNWKNFRRLIRTGIPFNIQKRYIRRDGTLIWVSNSVSLLRDAQSKPQLSCGIIVDVTKSRQIEDELRRGRDELEARVQERTRELGDALEQVRAEVTERRQAEAGRDQLVRRIVNTQEEERGRISRELHDNLGQHLTAVMLGLQALETQLETITEGKMEATQLSTLRGLVDGLMQAGHRQAWELRPAELDDMGLVAALRQFTSDWSRRTEVPVDFQAIGWDDQRIDSAIETTLYRVVQEALTNVARHADASNVSVVVELNDEGASAIVEDMGHGFDAETIEDTGRLGLVGMRERLAIVNGTLEIESAPNTGTTIFARVPLK